MYALKGLSYGFSFTFGRMVALIRIKGPGDTTTRTEIVRLMLVPGSRSLQSSALR